MTQVVLSEYGKEVLGNMELHNPDPVLLIGDSGWGKTTLLKHYCRTNARDFTGVNFYPKQGIEQLVGVHHPTVVDGNISVQWQDGLLTDAIRNGKIFLGEELTRAPRDLAGRLLGVLDSANRYWSIPEAGIPNIDVHPEFWFVASANPANGKYATTSLDPALARRFSYICEITEPLADEKALIASIASSTLKDAEGFADRMVKWVTDCRRSGDSKINTGDFARVVTAVTNKGLDIQRSITQTLSYKYPATAIESMVLNAESHLGTFKLERQAKAKVKVDKAEAPAAEIAEMKAHVEHNEAVEKAKAEAKPSNDVAAQIAELLKSISN